MSALDRLVPPALHHRLAVALLMLLLTIGAILLSVLWLTPPLHHQEILQRSQSDLAHNIVKMKEEQMVTADGRLRPAGLDPLFHWLMVVNPGLEVYLLDSRGEILAFDAPPGVVVRNRVELAPIRRFLAGDTAFPLLADDPRSPEGRKAFSVAPLPAEGPVRGYLFTILEGQKIDAATNLAWGGQILRFGLAGGFVALALAALAGGAIFRSLTRPLRDLTDRMARVTFGDDPGTVPGSETGREVHPTTRPGLGEVDQLERTFDAMVARLDRQLEKIAALGAQRHELVANISHDLRTPLASLQGYLETLDLKGESLGDAERAEFLDLALRQSHRLSRLVDELFELTKLDSELASPKLEPFSLAELVQDNLQRFHHDAQQRGITLCPPPGPDGGRVLADIGWIERVLQNLLENALRSTPAGGRVAVELEPRGDRLAVAVRDTGCGIAEDDLPLVFQRAFRCQMKGVPQGEGSGLGLAIAQRIIELHGDRIGVESQVGAGTTFRFSLALAS